MFGSSVCTLTAVTLPLSSTVAMSVAKDIQLTVLLSALSGETVAVNVAEEPFTRLRKVLSRETPVTEMGAGTGSRPTINPENRTSARNDEMVLGTSLFKSLRF